MQIRWGIIGCGDIAEKRVADAIRENPQSQLIAACRRNQEKLQDFCNRKAIPRAYTGADQLISDPDIDAVYLATPVNLHCEHAVAAANQGKHVLVEKPMAMSVDECDAMIHAAKHQDVILGVAYYRRFYPSVARIEELIKSGQIGRPFAATAAVSNGFGRDQIEGWRGDSRIAGGGALMDIGSHRLDLFVKLFGEARSVKALSTRLNVPYDAENSITLVCEFESEVQVTLQCFFGPLPNLDQFRVFGYDGRVDIENLNRERIIVTTIQGTSVESHQPAENLHAPLIQDFVEAVRERRPPACDGEEARKTNWIMAEAYRDGRTASPHDRRDEATG